MDVSENNIQNYLNYRNNKLRKIFSLETVNKLNLNTIKYLSFNESQHNYSISNNKAFYGMAIHSFLIKLFTMISDLDIPQTRRFLINGTDNIIIDIARLLMLASVNKFENIPSFIILDNIKYGGLNDDPSFSNLINSFINNNFEFEKEFDSYMGLGKCQYLFSQIDKLNSNIINGLIIDNVLLHDIIICIKEYYSRKVILSNTVVENKKLLINSFYSRLRKYIN